MDPGPLQRRCSRCGDVRPLGWFVRKGSGRLRSECRECGRAKRVEGAARRRSRLSVGRERVRQADIEAIGERQGWKCACGCGVSVRWAYHVDHRVPVSRGGRHEVANLRLLAPRCNLRLGASMRY